MKIEFSERQLLFYHLIGMKLFSFRSLLIAVNINIQYYFYSMIRIHGITNKNINDQS
jgi:hypothetical protein